MKSPIQSKMIGVNLVAGILSLLVVLTDQLTPIFDFIPDQYEPLIVTGMAGLNIVLRFMTHEPVQSVAESTKRIMSKVKPKS